MRIRTQLILASFLLAVIPLAAIVTYSYHSSRRALEAADRREAQRLAQQMDRRLASIRADLDQRITLVSALPVGDADSSDVGSSIAAAMGGVTSLVDSLEFKPLERVPRPPQPAAAAAPPAEAKVEAEAAPAAVAAVRPDDFGPRFSEDLAKAFAEAPHPPMGPVVIDLPSAAEFPRFVMSEEQTELVQEISTLGFQLGNPQLPADEREDIRKELHEAQKKLNVIIAADTRRFREHARQVRAAQRRTNTVAAPAPVPAIQPTPVPAPAPAPAPVVAKVQVRSVTPAEATKIKRAEEKTSLILGRKFNASVRKEGEVVGQLTPRINPERVIGEILGGAKDDGDEIRFAIDREGNVYARTETDRATIQRLGIPDRVRKGKSMRDIRGWVVSTTKDEQSGLHIGAARPVGEMLDELRKTAGRNFGLGMGLIVFALIGIVPLSNHLARDVKLVTDGAERIAQGDLMTRLPVKTNNELGQLAKAFNRMAEDLSHHQQKIVEQEVQQRLMTVEYDRKSVELEDARRFQLSMLPKQVPQDERYDIAVYTRTATEVGGDYYDFHLASSGALSITIGDATGHGAKAGTMVTIVKALFAGYSGAPPASFLHDAAETIKRMDLERMSMALSLASLDGYRLTLASAGMPPVLVHRVKKSEVEEIALNATPLGTLGVDYNETSVTLEPGDTALFLTDGFPELMNDAGQQFGYAAALDAFASAATAANADGVIAALTETVRNWHGDAPPNDDVTFVVVRIA